MEVVKTLSWPAFGRHCTHTRFCVWSRDPEPDRKTNGKTFPTQDMQRIKGGQDAASNKSNQFSLHGVEQTPLVTIRWVRH